MNSILYPGIQCVFKQGNHCSPVEECIKTFQVQLLEDILDSDCVISTDALDKGLFQLSHSADVTDNRDTYLKILDILIRHGAIIKYINFFGQFFRLSFSLLYTEMDGIIQTILKVGSNYQNGLLLWGMLEKRYYSCPDRWKDLTYPHVKHLYITGFKPTEFLTLYSETKDHFCSFVALQYLLPMSHLLEDSVLSKLTHKLFQPAEFDLRQFFEVMVCLGYKLPASVIVNCHNGEFDININIRKRVLALCEWCRIKIRASVIQPNVVSGISRLTLPLTMKQYLLLGDLVHPDLVAFLLADR